MANMGHNQPPVVNISSLSPDDKKTLKSAISELNDSLTRAAAERELQKEIIEKTFDDIGISKKLIRRMAKVYFRANFKEELEDNSQFEQFYVNLFESKSDGDGS